MKQPVLAAVFLVALAGCWGGGTDDPTSGPAPIAIVDDGGNVSVFDPASGILTAVTADAGPGRVYSQPTWSPGGARLAFVASGSTVPGPAVEAGDAVVRVSIDAQDLTSAIHIWPASGGPATVIPTPFAAFYLYWAPDGSHLAFLGNDGSIGGQALGMVDVAAGTVERIDTGSPFYFAWSPESDRLLVHAAGRELYVLGLDGGREPLGPSVGGFSAPNWVPGTRLFPTEEAGRRVLRFFDADGTPRRDAAEHRGAVALELNPDGERVAFIDIEPAANPFDLGALVVDAPAGRIEITDAAAAFFWSPDGGSLLYLTPDLGGGDFFLRWNLWDGETSVSFERFAPTVTFVREYLPFFGQYALSLSFMAPDGSAFTFGGTIEGRGAGLWLQPADAGAPPVRIGGGEFSTWAQ